MFKRQSTEKLVRKNLSPINDKENNSYARKYSRKLLSRQSNHEDQENTSDNVLTTYNSNTFTNNQNLYLAQLQQTITQQKRQIQNLKMGCPRCLNKQNSDLELRNKILIQNNQILQLLSRDSLTQDYADIYKQFQQLQQQNEELKKNNEILIMNQQQILQENLMLKNMFAEQQSHNSNSGNIRENSSQLFSLSQSQGRFSSILQLNSQVHSPSHAQQQYDKLYNLLK